MRVIPPLAVTDAVLISSSIVEVAPAAHAIGTTYSAGATSSTGVIGGVITVWKSLAAGNVGHAPSSSPTWWQNIGTTYAVYDPTHSYSLDDYVIDPVAHLVYQSMIAGANLGQPLATGTAWRPAGPTNKMAAFDNLRNTQTVAPVDIVYTLAPGVRTDSIAVIGLDASSVSISVTTGGREVYAVSVALSLRKSFRWRDYFFGQFKTRKAIQFFNLPPYRNAEITVTVHKTNGLRAVGGIIVGNAVYLGKTLAAITSDHLNFSNVERDKFGNVTLQPRRSVPKVNERVVFDKSLTSALLEVRERLNGVPAVWSALDDFRSNNFEPTFIFGIHKEFSLDLEPSTHGIITLELEEV
ncbi:hypothetical protein NHH73_24895 [Oxalobacteraceae bacterium OTU3CINTB1]|nr:hypothetical protein NHH73_24895 [Oxalobacteraceae bacterium OTU3CINTB1]